MTRQPQQERARATSPMDVVTAASTLDSSTMVPLPLRRHVAATPRGSLFELSLMPQDKIFTRTLQPWSVHHSLTTSNWIATISRPEPIDGKLKYTQFCFPDERQARKFCKAYAPPRVSHNNNSNNNKCQLCQTSSSLMMQSSSHHRQQCYCRNCGTTCCDKCSRRWGHRMVPKTYNVSQSSTVRVCTSCDWLSNAFCLSLLQGRYQDARRIHATGNVNLRTTFADIHREAMFPIHCAVMGGSLELVQWLVDVHLCPLSVSSNNTTTNNNHSTNNDSSSNKGRLLSVQTSASRTLLDLAMTGRPKVDILMYLIQKGLSIHDAKDPLLAVKTLEAILKTGVHPTAATAATTTFPAPPLHIVESLLDESITTSMDNADDVCALCCERNMDCVLSPCGHQICCADCGSQLTACPVCKASCQVLRIFRS